MTLVPVLRASYAKHGLLRMVAHRDMSMQIRRLFLRAGLPMRYSEGFSPKPRFHFAPPLPLGVSSSEEWIDVELDAPLDPEEFLEAVTPQCLEGLEFRRCLAVDRKAPRLEELLQFADWRFRPYDLEGAAARRERLLAAVDATEMVITRRNKKGKVREVDVRPRIRLVEPDGDAVRVVMGASTGAPEGPLGLFDFLRACLPDLEEHPLTVFEVERRGFLRDEDGALVPSL